MASRAPGGRLWAANMVGAAGFDPAAVTHGHTTPNLLVESVTADATGFRGPTSARRFEFRYSAPDLAAAQSLRFRYKLDELDRDWVDAGTARTAPYSKLPPGDYRFHVMVGGSDGQWHEGSPAIALRVVPRFWERRWGQVLAGATFLSAIGASLAWNQRRTFKLRLERLETQHTVEKERARIARDIHDDLGASLTEIALMSDPEPEEFAEPGRVRAQLQRISGKARTIVQALNEIVWAVNPRNDNLPKLLDYLCTFSEELCECAGVRFAAITNREEIGFLAAGLYQALRGSKAGSKGRIRRRQVHGHRCSRHRDARDLPQEPVRGKAIFPLPSRWSAW